MSELRSCPVKYDLYHDDYRSLWLRTYVVDHIHPSEFIVGIVIPMMNFTKKIVHADVAALHYDAYLSICPVTKV